MLGSSVEPSLVHLPLNSPLAFVRRLSHATLMRSFLALLLLATTAVAELKNDIEFAKAGDRKSTRLNSSH